MAYLTRWDSHNRPFPELATEIPTQENGGISRDGKTITWHIRRGVRWSDGAPFDADDVVFTTNAINNPVNNETSRDGWDLITRIDEPDKYTVVYHLRKVYAPFLPTFFGTAGVNPCILPKHLLEQYPNINDVAYNALPVGIGPFRYTAWKRGDRIEMEANPYYWRGLPKLKRITYSLIPSRDTLLTLLQTREVDLWPAVPPQYIREVKSLDGVTTTLWPGAVYAHMDFNVQRPLVADIRVRSAIRLAIDRRALLDKISHGYGVLQESVVPPIVAIAPTGIPLMPFDREAAKRLLAEAGWEPGPDGIRTKNGTRLALSFPYYTGSAATDAQVELVRDMLKNVGIELVTRKVDPALFFGPYESGGLLLGGNWDATLFTWQSGTVGDLSGLFACNQIPPRGQNVVRFCNAQLDTWLEEFNATNDAKVHSDLLRKEVNLVVAEVPTIVLSIPEFGYAFVQEVSAFTPGAITPFDQMMLVDI